MIEVLLDTALDSIKLFPFLLITYIAMEYLEHRTSAKTKSAVKKSGKYGPAVGALLGAFPQCGFSAAASNLYAGRVVTLGTLISIYLSTSDEMLPILISEQAQIGMILSIIVSKILIGMMAGFAIDLCMKKTRKDEDVDKKIGHLCEHDHCHCDKSIVKSALKHTFIIMGYILAISFVLNIAIYFIGEDNVSSIILNRPIAGPAIAGIVGLIPNCAASVVITQLYINGVMSLGSMMAGLLAGAGVGILVLFRVNDNLKENVRILGIVYVIGVISGIIIDLVTAII